MINGISQLGLYAIAVKFEDTDEEFYYAGKDRDKKMSFGQEERAKTYKTHRYAMLQLCDMRRLRPFGTASYFLRKMHFNRETLQFRYEPCNEY